MTSKSRKIKLNKNYQPLPVYEGDEFFPNGIFNFNISRIFEDVNAGLLQVEHEQILWKNGLGHMGTDLLMRIIYLQWM
jgi:hypothetical protein